MNKLKTQRPISTKALQVMAFQDFKASNGRAVRFMHHQGLILHQRTTSVQSFMMTTLKT